MMAEKKGKPAIYFAGRIRKERSRFNLGPATTLDADTQLYAESIHPIEMENCIYTGPFTFGDDHGCNHRGIDDAFGVRNATGTTPEAYDEAYDDCFGTRSHGASYDCCFNGYKSDKSIRKAVFQRALNGIRAADFFFAWVDDEECFGTLVEIGIAKAMGKPVYIGIASHIKARGELWFGLYAACHLFPADTAEEAVKTAIARIRYCRRDGGEQS